MRELGGRRLYLRPGTADMNTIVLNYVRGTHLPPAELVNRDLRQICESEVRSEPASAGSLRDIPRARVLGVEPDPGNVALLGLRRRGWAFGVRR
jgi:hypothetical protein